LRGGEKMTFFLTFLKGKLTYFVAGVIVVWAFVGYFSGNHDWEAASKLLFEGLAVFGIRRAIT